LSSRAVAAALALAVARPAAAEEMLRVAVARDLPRVVLAAQGLEVRPLGADAKGRQAEAGRIEIASREGGLAVDGTPEPGEGVAVVAAEPIRLGERLLAPEVEVLRGPSGLDVVEVLPLEAYVAGVVAGEMPEGVPRAALEAQAVAARSYALVKKIEAQASNRRWDLGAGVLAQVYAGAAPHAAARAAAEATKGEVLALGQEPVEAYFHAICGGRTERGADALGRDLAYLRSVRCGQCDGAPRARWTADVAPEDLARAAGLAGKATAVRVAGRTATGRVQRLEVSAGASRATISAVDLRQRLGYARLPSLWFEVAARGGQFRFEGRGAGHGAGLCQWGAAGFARAGRSYREILAHYYPGTEVVRMY
jgi:stage II sporulation protein D